MTDEQINAAIADATGWTAIWGEGCDPDYCNDLNEMHEAEKVLNQDNLYIMALHIEGLCGRGEFYFRATARQRAEAFLRAIEKWKEVQK